MDVSTTPSVDEVKVYNTLEGTTNISLSLMLESGKTKIFRDESAESYRKGSHKLQRWCCPYVSSVKLSCLIHNCHVLLLPLDRLKCEYYVDDTYLDA
jgi:hypothetical protein